MKVLVRVPGAVEWPPITAVIFVFAFKSTTPRFSDTLPLLHGFILQCLCSHSFLPFVNNSYC